MSYLRRPYTVCVTTFQMAVLLAFNSSDLHTYRWVAVTCSSITVYIQIPLPLSPLSPSSPSLPLPPPSPSLSLLPSSLPLSLPPPLPPLSLSSSSLLHYTQLGDQELCATLQSLIDCKLLLLDEGEVGNDVIVSCVAAVM